MKLLRTICLLPLIILFVASISAQDRVEYKRDGKANSSTGQIVEESISTIRIKPSAGKELTVAPSEVTKISYEVTGPLKQELTPIFALEEKRESAKALEEYEKVLEKVRTSDRASAGLKRQVEYRIAMLQAATGKVGADASLSAFLKANANSWQYPYAARQLASLQVSANKFDDAVKTLVELSGVAGLPKDVKTDTEVAIIDVQFQAGKLTEAKTRADTLIKTLTSNDPYSRKLPMYQIGSSCKDGKLDDTVAKLQKAIDTTTDVGVKALGYNVLGYAYLLNGNKREAMWQFLWVDTVYNTDPIERLKALDQLTKLYQTDLANPERAQLFREKAARLR